MINMDRLIIENITHPIVYLCSNVKVIYLILLINLLIHQQPTNSIS